MSKTLVAAPCIRVLQTLTLFNLFLQVSHLTSISSLRLDDDTLTFQQKVRARVSRGLNKPYFQKKKLKITAGVIAEIVFDFEYLHGVFPHCDLIFHEGGNCFKLGQVSPNPSAETSSTVASRLIPPLPKLHQIGAPCGTFLFKGNEAELAMPSVARNLFAPKPVLRKPTIRRCEEGESSNAVVNHEPHMELPLITLKRARHVKSSASPKKPKLLLLLKDKAHNSPKRVKTPGVKLIAKAFGLRENTCGLLVPRLSGESTDATKKRKGRPYGSKNKPKETKVETVVGRGPSIQAESHDSGPSVKGKEKV